jgi:hypothetical protein
MSKNAFTPEQSEEIFNTLEGAIDKVKALEQLADRFFTEPKNLKNFLAKKHAKEYNEWFGASVKEPSLMNSQKDCMFNLLKIKLQTWLNAWENTVNNTEKLLRTGGG